MRIFLPRSVYQSQAQVFLLVLMFQRWDLMEQPIQDKCSKLELEQGNA